MGELSGILVLIYFSLILIIIWVIIRSIIKITSALQQMADNSDRINLNLEKIQGILSEIRDSILSNSPPSGDG